MKFSPVTFVNLITYFQAFELYFSFGPLLCVYFLFLISPLPKFDYPSFLRSKWSVKLSKRMVDVSYIVHYTLQYFYCLELCEVITRPRIDFSGQFEKMYSLRNLYLRNCKMSTFCLRIEFLLELLLLVYVCFSWPYCRNIEHNPPFGSVSNFLNETKAENNIYPDSSGEKSILAWHYMYKRSWMKDFISRGWEHLSFTPILRVTFYENFDGSYFFKVLLLQFHNLNAVLNR